MTDTGLREFKRPKIFELRLFWVFAAILLMLIASPIVETFADPELEVYLIPFFLFLIVASVYMSSESVFWRAFATVSGVLWLILKSLKLSGIDGGINLASDFVLFGLLFTTLVVLLVRVVTSKTVDFDEVCGGLAVYFLIAVTWAVSYRLLETIAPGSLNIPASLGHDDWTPFMYFSMTTVTTLGYGDITPVSPIARFWATLQAATGVLYIAVTVARLVAAYRRMD